jgi:aryl-alcohol dehydrogenase-like predicted oxidoreductase
VGKGLLTGKIDVETPLHASDFRNRVPRFAPAAREAGRAPLDGIAALGERIGAAPARVALARLLAKRPWIVPRFGSRRGERLDESRRALAVALTPEQVGGIDRLSSGFRIAGERYPQDLMQRSGV